MSKSKLEYYQWFKNPVDKNVVADYYLVIKTPMDLGTVESKLKKKMYK